MGGGGGGGREGWQGYCDGVGGGGWRSSFKSTTDIFTVPKFKIASKIAVLLCIA